MYAIRSYYGSRRLQQLTARSQSQSANFEQSYLFEQYAGVLDANARRALVRAMLTQVVDAALRNNFV